MSKRYSVTEGIVIRRTALPSGDVVVTLLGEEGKWRGVARKGKLLGGNVGKLSLFHDVTVQHYRKGDEDLSLITQVQLNGALPRLSAPERYPYAHVLAELTDKLTADVNPGEMMHGYLAAGLRGLSGHADPEAVTLVLSWKLLQQAGLSPRLQRCVHCGAAEVTHTFDVAGGGMTCEACGVTGMRLSPGLLGELQSILLDTVRNALAEPVTERRGHWALLSRYIAFHVGDVRSLAQLSLYEVS